MIELGVSSRQADKARRALMRSAQQAIFFEHGDDRLVLPTPNGLGTKPIEPTIQTHGSGGGGGEEPPIDPIIQGLINRLLHPGKVWPEVERKLWLQIVENGFKLIYKSEPEQPKGTTVVTEPIVPPEESVNRQDQGRRKHPD